MPDRAELSKPRKASALFRYIEGLQREIPWGSVLDAGTGTNSIEWISNLATNRWTAVTGAEGHAVQVRDAVEAARRPQDRIVLGNWAAPTLLAGERYDTVLADYLIGAVEGFAPYFQHKMFVRLRPLVGRRLYIVGLEPYVNAAADTPAGDLIREIGRFRDACMLLTGDTPYREYPAQWVVDHLEASGFQVTAAKRFPIRYKERFVNSQIDMCGPRLAKLANRALAGALRAEGEELRARAIEQIMRDGALRHGHDYVIAAQPAAE
ncbi:class I SAM-dependent methyltransferase [Sphingobium sp. BYY-5]|uniref:class I SAM-dependent methyltransferase n=1 Tax=Sphingobium sp. BYY-5 TaxID=2926400 RepID=UPI001FA6C4ED|nr:class I SAM-dependent methyltransferase [Sphingobium sp. BYY-5]MCI4591082.1 class I SAM-dependent methyltransferase [Sphingobium sp. BYY-5]